jgi:hypothetical protein
MSPTAAIRGRTGDDTMANPQQGQPQPTQPGQPGQGGQQQGNPPSQPGQGNPQPNPGQQGGQPDSER